MEILANEVDQARHQREAGNQEQQCGNKARLVGRLDAQEMLSRSNQEDVDHRSKSTAGHPHTEVVHVTHKHLTTQCLAEERRHGDGRTLDPSPTVEECERRTREARCKRVRKPVVQTRHLRDLVELVGHVLNAHGLALERSDVVIDAIDLVCVHAHQALLSELRTECTVRVSGRNDLCISDLCTVLRNTDCACEVSHRLLDAIGARAKRQKHLPESQYDLRLMGEAVVRRHTLGEDLVFATVVVRPVRVCRSDHTYSIARKSAKRGRRWSVTCGFSSAGHAQSENTNGTEKDTACLMPTRFKRRRPASSGLGQNVLLGA